MSRRSFRHGDKRLTCPHDNRLREINPTAFAHGRRRQQAKALAGAGVDLEDGYLATGRNTFEMNSWNESVVRKLKREPGVLVEWNHLAFALNRINVNFSALVIALIAASRFSAALRLGWAS